LENWDLIAKRVTGNTTKKEDQEFDLWLKHDSANEISYKKTEVLWNAISGMNVSIEADVDAEWEKFLATVKNEENKKITLSPGRRIALLAAALVITIAASVTLIRLFMGAETVITPVADKVIVAPEKYAQVTIFAADTAQLFTLPDSSAVFLNSNSSARYLNGFIGPYRVVHLKGEGLFDVQENERPFIVFAGETEIRVVGTSFNVKLDKTGETVELTVIEGTVTFKEKDAAASSEILVEKNERITYHKSTHAVMKSKAGSNLWWKKIDWNETRDGVKNLIDKLKIR
jgi:transmembrane sensor